MSYRYFTSGPQHGGNNFDWRFIALITAAFILYFIHESRSSRGSTTITKTIRDTIHTSKTDTLWKEIKNNVQLKINVPDTIYIDSSNYGDVHRLVYDNEYSDSLLSANFKIVVDGVLVEHNFKYISKYPKYIHTIDTFRINTINTVTQNKNQLFLGLDVGGDATKFNISPSILLKTKKDFIYSYRYGLLDRSHNIGIAKLLTFKK